MSYDEYLGGQISDEGRRLHAPNRWLAAHLEAERRHLIATEPRPSADAEAWLDAWSAHCADWDTAADAGVVEPRDCR